MTTASATQSSTLLIDEELPYLAAGKPAAHRIRVYETDSWATLVITDSSKKNACISVTNSVEPLVEEFLRQFSRFRFERLVIVEHFEPYQLLATPTNEESFSFVKLSRNAKNGVLHNPTWTYASRAKVESWTGFPIE